MLGAAEQGTNQNATTAVGPPRCECGGKGAMRGWYRGSVFFIIDGRLMD